MRVRQATREETQTKTATSGWIWGRKAVRIPKNKSKILSTAIAMLPRLIWNRQPQSGSMITGEAHQQRKLMQQMAQMPRGKPKRRYQRVQGVEREQQMTSKIPNEREAAQTTTHSRIVQQRKPINLRWVRGITHHWATILTLICRFQVH